VALKIEHLAEREILSDFSKVEMSLQALHFYESPGFTDKRETKRKAY
jgi:hypothetical protein